MIVRSLFAAALLTVSSAPLGACTHSDHDRSSPTLTKSLQEDDAYREASRRCGARGVRQAEGTAGDNPSDYSCGRP
jgi:hypothetical protein